MSDSEGTVVDTGADLGQEAAELGVGESASLVHVLHGGLVGADGALCPAIAPL